VLVYPAPQSAAVDYLRHVRARYRPGPCHRPAWVSCGRMLLRTSHHKAVGDHLPRSICRLERGNAAERAASPDAAVRGRSRAADLAVPAVHRTPRPTLRRPHLLVLYAALRNLALHHRVLSRRRARHDHGFLDLA